MWRGSNPCLKINFRETPLVEPLTSDTYLKQEMNRRLFIDFQLHSQHQPRLGSSAIKIPSRGNSVSTRSSPKCRPVVVIRTLTGATFPPPWSESFPSVWRFYFRVTGGKLPPPGKEASLHNFHSSKRGGTRWRWPRRDSNGNENQRVTKGERKRSNAQKRIIVVKGVALIWIYASRPVISRATGCSDRWSKSRATADRR